MRFGHPLPSRQSDYSLPCGRGIKHLGTSQLVVMWITILGHSRIA